MERKIYTSIDIVKFLMALLILGGHTAAEWAHSTGLVHLVWGVSNFAVPFFFACSGFLFFEKVYILPEQDQIQYYKKWSIRVLKMYAVWSLVYFCFYFFGDWVPLGFPQDKILNWCHRSLVFSTYATIWFLPALWIGVSLCFWLRRICTSVTFWGIMILLVVIGNSFGAYSNVITTNSTMVSSFYDWYMQVFITWRNGVFNGAPYVAIGLLVLKNNKRITLSFKTLSFLTMWFCVLYLIEGFLIVSCQLGSATDQGFIMIPAIYFMLLALLKWDVQPRPLWLHCRNLSMLIFLDQRLFLTAIPRVLPQSYSTTILSWPEPCIYLYFAISVITFSVLIERLSVKFKFLKLFW